MKPVNIDSPYEFNNQFLFMRHGESHANRHGIIVSDPENGLDDFSLTGQGVKAVADKAMRSRLDSNVLVVCSDFLRTKQTANIVAEVLDAAPAHETASLRERYFGDWEGKSAQHYDAIWRDDEQGIVKHNVETIASVLQRMLHCVWELETTHTNQRFLLVSHGDCLQILLSWMLGMSPRFHRHIPPIKPASIRSVNNTQSLQNIFNILNIEAENPQAA